MTVDYRLAPEHPHPAAIDDAVAAYRGLLDSGVAASAIAIAGESAGAKLAAATLVALKHAGLLQPTGAVLMSPWADLTLSGESISAKAAADPALTPTGLRRRAVDYVADGDPAEDLVSPIFADLTGLPPLLIQAGSHEILLDDATRLAARAAAPMSPSGSKSHPASRTCSKASLRCSTKATRPCPSRQIHPSYSCSLGVPHLRRGPRQSTTSRRAGKKCDGRSLPNTLATPTRAAAVRAR